MCDGKLFINVVNACNSKSKGLSHRLRQGRLRWFGHVERKSGDDWMSACRNVVVAGVRCAGLRVEGGSLGMNE